jgi:hypothetical protein
VPSAPVTAFVVAGGEGLMEGNTLVVDVLGGGRDLESETFHGPRKVLPQTDLPSGEVIASRLREVPAPLANEVGSAPPVFESIGSGSRVSGRLVSSTLRMA